MSIVPDRFYCPIDIADIMTDPVQLPCGHNFGKAIFKWLEKSSACPICRFEVKWYHWVEKNTELQNEIIQFFDDHPQTKRPEGLEKTFFLTNTLNRMRDRFL